MKRASLVLGFILMYLAGCSPGDMGTGANGGGLSLADYIPLKEGNSWTYAGIASAANGVQDTALSGSTTVSVYQTNVPIGGRPNAFVLRTANQRGLISYLAFCIDGRTLLHYMGGTRTYMLQDNLILWIPGGAGAAAVGVGEARRFQIVDRSGANGGFVVLQGPDASVAHASMTSPDTVEIKGVSEGQTAFTLGAVGGSAGDTMTVIVAVRNDLPSDATSPLIPWIPIWQLADSASGETVFSFDTIFSFRRFSDSVRCEDRLTYLITNRYLGSEPVKIQETPLNCEKFEMNVALMETITSEERGNSTILFSGSSGNFVVKMWLARGIGFVKGIVDGSSLPPAAAMGGVIDTSGVLHGYYVSPRVVYASVDAPPYSRKDYFYVNERPLGTTSTHDEFILTKKNF